MVIAKISMDTDHIREQEKIINKINFIINSLYTMICHFKKQAHIKRKTILKKNIKRKQYKQ